MKSLKNSSKIYINELGGHTNDFEVETEVPSAGWGHCKSCSCRGFIDDGFIVRSNTCGNCGHAFSQHR